MKTRHRLRTGIAMVAVTTAVLLAGWDTARVSAGPSGGSDAAAHPSRHVKAAVHDPLTALLREWPVRGPINSRFGARRSGAGHAGIDIGTRPGTPVRAPAAGSVAFVGWRHGYGRTVVLDHGHGVESLYGHLSKFGVTPGQRLEPGGTIGLTGVSGNASGSHLHYEVHVKGRPVNPRGTTAATTLTMSSRTRRG